MADQPRLRKYSKIGLVKGVNEGSALCCADLLSLCFGIGLLPALAVVEDEVAVAGGGSTLRRMLRSVRQLGRVTLFTPNLWRLPVVVRDIAATS